MPAGGTSVHVFPVLLSFGHNINSSHLSISPFHLTFTSHLPSSPSHPTVILFWRGVAAWNPGSPDQKRSALPLDQRGEHRKLCFLVDQILRAKSYLDTNKIWNWANLWDELVHLYRKLSSCIGLSVRLSVTDIYLSVQIEGISTYCAGPTPTFDRMLCLIYIISS